MYINTNISYLRFAVVEGADGISAYLDMLDTWYAEHRLFFVDVDVDVDDDVDVDVDDIYIMMMSVFVCNENYHFFLGVSCNHLNHR